MPNHIEETTAPTAGEIDGQTAIEFTTSRGRTVRVGERYRDAHRETPRVLRVESIGVYQRPGYGGAEPTLVCSVTCSVTRPRGDVIDEMKPTTMTADRITGKDFIRIDEGGQ